MVWPGGMTCIWYGLAGMAWYMVWSSRHDMVCGVVWRAWHGIWYRLVASYGTCICIGLKRCGMVYVILWWGTAWYMVWPLGHDMVYRMVWRGMARYMIWHCGHGMAWYLVWPGEVWYGK